jgi:hypothetical protein
LLDKPYPENLAVVFVCEDCNNSLSLDEEYLACFMECVISGSVNPEHIKREKIKRRLLESPALSKLISESMQVFPDGSIMWSPELDRIQKVIEKLARGHVSVDYYKAPDVLERPSSIQITPFQEMSREQYDNFNSAHLGGLWPEVGVRAFERSAKEGENSWQVVQKDRYRYMVSWQDQIVVRIALSEYLACEVIWELE